jgi:hypothetical protein
MSTRKRWVVTMTLLGLLPACVSGEPPPPAPSTPDQTTPVQASRLPPPLAEIRQENGNTISFYDLGGNSVITGEGPAGNPAALPANMREMDSMTVLEAWNRLSGGQAAPQPLVDFQKRLAANPAPPPDVKVTRTAPQQVDEGLPAEDAPLDTPDGTLAAPVGCNNGCCDQDWMKSAFTECQNWLDTRWMSFNYLYSHSWRSNVNSASVFLCSASGTSEWTLTISGTGPWIYSVGEARYLQWYWHRGSWDFAPRTVDSWVNTQSNQHLHTQCGIVQNFW